MATEPRARTEPPGSAEPAETAERGAPPERAEVVVIGGGVIGLSIAAELAGAGVETVLLERDTPGSGASKATADVLRAYFAGNPVSSAMAVRSLAAYREWDGLPMRPTGYLVLFTDAEQVSEWERQRPAQHDAGVDVELIDAAEARRRNPLIAPNLPLTAAAWSPQAYVSDTAAIVAGFVRAARRAGAGVHSGCRVTDVDTVTGRVGIAGGRSVTAGTVVCAAGAWSAPIARMAGVDLPLAEPVVQELLTAGPLPDAPDIPITLHAASGLLVRRRGEGLLVGMGYPGPDRDDWRDRVRRQLALTYPHLTGAEIGTAFTGVRDASPDRTAFIGRAPGDTPFLYAAGFSGHGLCVAPAAGQIVRDLYLGRDPGIPVAKLDVSRHRTGRRDDDD
ncbi:FAD-binding oxidoreductase [Actinomadura logoneensis]|uniref:FAD-binding oxidoreductase n=1 Tax=Actinomadura logoneensis TaxID=2293572 RepID=A0A372JAD8_9ACTN|nr:FAD-dependent oxidoreductase [Actinomadura logoneensis]RFU36957.1 FAD-binding oxidoreductase [Actinomadura logoneensis]